MIKKYFFCLVIILLFFLGCTQVFTGSNGTSEVRESRAMEPLLEPANPVEPGIPAGDTWQMFRHDARHTGHVAARAPVTPTVLWKVNVGLPMYSSPAIANRMVFVGASNVLLAFDERTGKTLWKSPMAGEIYSSPAVDLRAGKRGLVYTASYGSRSSTLSAFDMQTGTRVWWTWMITKSSPAIAYNRLPDPSADIYPPVPRATLFIGAGNGLKAYDADTGRLLWNFQAYGVVDSTPAVDERNVYFGTNNNMIFAVDRYTGKGVWKFEAKGAVVSSPAVGDKFLVAASLEGVVYSLYKDTGKQAWTVSTGGIIKSSPAYYNGYIYIGSGFRLVKLNEDGKIEWQARTLGETFSSPALSSGRVYIGSSKTKSSSIFCFDDNSGKQIWSQWMQVEASPSLAYWSLIVPTLEGYLYCFNDLE